MATRADIIAFRNAVAADVARLDTRIERLDAAVKARANTLTLRLGSLIVLVGAAVVAAAHVWPPP